jgi:hypothetical protein
MMLLMIGLLPPASACGTRLADYPFDTARRGSDTKRETRFFGPHPKAPDTYDIVHAGVIDGGTYSVSAEVYEDEILFRSASVTITATDEGGPFVVKDDAGNFLLNGAYEVNPDKLWIDIWATAGSVRLPPFSKVGDHAKGMYLMLRGCLTIILAGPGLARPSDWTSPLLHKKGSKYLLLMLKNDAYRRAKKPDPPPHP